MQRDFRRRYSSLILIPHESVGKLFLVAKQKVKLSPDLPTFSPLLAYHGLIMVTIHPLNFATMAAAVGFSINHPPPLFSILLQWWQRWDLLINTGAP